jgi:plasmid stabilization system protein ParE
VSPPVRYRPEAFADVAEAFSWYQAQRVGLGWEFVAELENTVALLQRVPEVGPVVHRSLRRALLRRFPYAVYYELDPDKVHIRAVLHMRRHPRRWQARA